MPNYCIEDAFDCPPEIYLGIHHLIFVAFLSLLQLVLQFFDHYLLPLLLLLQLQHPPFHVMLLPLQLLRLALALLLLFL